MKKFLLFAFAVCLLEANANEISKQQKAVFVNDTKDNMRKDSVREALRSTNESLFKKETEIVEKIRQLFQKGKIDGNFRIQYAGYENYSQNPSQYSTAFGGSLQYSLARLYGLSAGVEFTTSQDIRLLSGDRELQKNNPELSSQSGSYTEVTQAYVDYIYKGFGFRLGRQQLETPLADSDDARMIKNSFEAYTLHYINGSQKLLLGHINRWQGNDAVDKNGNVLPGWIKAGEKGVNFIGLAYGDMWEYNAWFYNMPNIANSYYVDVGVEYPLNSITTLHIMTQYLYQESLGSQYGAKISGILCEFVYDGFGFNVAFNHAARVANKKAFIGVGGGSFFSSMDSTDLDMISYDRSVDAVVGGLTYKNRGFIGLFAYGEFRGGKDSSGASKDLSELDIMIGYELKKEFKATLIYAYLQDLSQEKRTEFDFSRLQLTLNYNFYVGRK